MEAKQQKILANYYPKQVGKHHEIDQNFFGTYIRTFISRKNSNDLLKPFSLMINQISTTFFLYQLLQKMY